MNIKPIVRCRQDYPLWEFYQRLRAKLDNQVKIKAHVAVQKKLLRYRYVLANKQQAFNPKHIRDLQARCRSNSGSGLRIVFGKKYHIN